jgi:hypothetical protein
MSEPHTDGITDTSQACVSRMLKMQGIDKDSGAELESPWVYNQPIPFVLPIMPTKEIVSCLVPYSPVMSLK